MKKSNTANMEKLKEARKLFKTIFDRLKSLDNRPRLRETIYYVKGFSHAIEFRHYLFTIALIYLIFRLIIDAIKIYELNLLIEILLKAVK